MEPDFSGWATKSGIQCSDGRTIMPGAFRDQDKTQVPLVWQHGHTDPENVLGHVMLEHRDEGVYAFGFFNDSVKAKHAKQLLQHKDINMLSIWANQLMERSKKVLHGAIREVSLVLAGANPGAIIENVTLHHSDGEDELLEEEAIIHSGVEIDVLIDEEEDIEPIIDHAANATDGNLTFQDVYDSMTDQQKELLHFLVGEASDSSSAGSVAQDAMDDDSKGSEGSKDSKISTETDEEGSKMKHNVFEDKDGDTKPERHVLSHDDMKEIVKDGERRGSLKEAVTEWALAHGINDIDTLFPDAQAIDNVPEFLQRRTEWVNGWFSGTRKSPFSRIKTLTADITMDEARAKGYVTGDLKREEFFSVMKRVTNPTTVYKKQRLDRDDIVDITDFDVVAWLKAEMRVLLDEEVARAALMGDGRDISNDDKINEQNIRPIATDHELYVTTLRVNLLDASSSVQEFIDSLVENRSKYKGTGIPTMYTKESVIAKFLLLKDTLGRDIYKTIDEVASKLRVSAIVPVEAMEEDDELLAIIVNPADYVYGATRGGEVSMFDDFDIDYNQYKYLIETRCCGALVRLKSAIVIRGTAAADVLTVPNPPTFDFDTGVLTIVATTGITYKNADTDATLSTGAQTAIGVGETIRVRAVPGANKYIPTTEDSYWEFTREH